MVRSVILIPSNMYPILHFLNKSIAIYIIHCVSDVIKSAIGLAIWIAGLVSWIVVFQRNRSEWGAFGDQISFLIPLGQP